MKKLLFITLIFLFPNFIFAQNYLLISDIGNDRKPVNFIITFDTSSIKNKIIKDEKDLFYNDYKFLYIDSSNYFLLVKYLKIEGLLYSDIKNYEIGTYFIFYNQEKKEIFYQIYNTGNFQYKKVRKKIIQIPKIKYIIKLLDRYFGFPPQASASVGCVTNE